MLSRKFILTILGLLLAVIAVSKASTGGTVEGFWMTGNRGVKTMNYVKDRNGNEVAVDDYLTLHPNHGNDKFVKVSNFQGLLSPRFSNVGMPAHVRYNLPDQKNMAAPCNPLDHGARVPEGYAAPVVYAAKPQEVREGYCGCGNESCGPQCKRDGRPSSLSLGAEVPYELPGGAAGFAAGNYNQQVAQLHAENDAPAYHSDLPVAELTTTDAAGNVEQPVVYQRFMFARPQGKLRQHGDPIRGDLAIVPCSGGEWFNVHPNINIDLQEGAMNVIGGVRNESNNALAELINRASGGADTTIGGVDLSNYNAGAQQQVALSGAFGDVSVSAYP